MAYLCGGFDVYCVADLPATVRACLIVFIDMFGSRQAVAVASPAGLDLPSYLVLMFFVSGCNSVLL